MADLRSIFRILLLGVHTFLDTVRSTIGTELNYFKSFFSCFASQEKIRSPSFDPTTIKITLTFNEFSTLPMQLKIVFNIFQFPALKTTRIPGPIPKLFIVSQCQSKAPIEIIEMSSYTNKDTTLISTQFSAFFNFEKLISK